MQLIFYTLLKGPGGKTIDITNVPSYDERYMDSHVFTSYSPLSRLFGYGKTFRAVLDSVPEPPANEDMVVYRYNGTPENLRV